MCAGQFHENRRKNEKTRKLDVKSNILVPKKKNHGGITLKLTILI